METTHHGEDASPDNPPRQQKSGNTDEQTIALTKARLAIDEVDARIVELLKKRAEWVHEVGRIKKEKNSPIFVPERETVLLNKLNRLNAGVLPEASLQAIYREIISCSFFLEGGLTIAYLGPKGTWSHQAALKQFGKSCELIPCQSFKDVFDMVDRGKAQYGVVPVENSSEGSVTAVMDLFVTSPLKICAQINLNIRNSLMAAIPREHIRILYSHPQVLGQTRDWILRRYPNAELVETSSTTKASILAKENAAMGAASIQPHFEADSTMAAEFDLKPGQRVELRLDIFGTLSFEREGADYAIEAPVAYAAPAQLALKLPDARLVRGRARWIVAAGAHYGPAVILDTLKLGVRVT